MTTKFIHLRPILGFKASVDCYINRCSGVLEKRTKSFDIFYFSSEGHLLNLWWFCFLTVFVFVLRVSCLFHPIQKLLVSHVIFFQSIMLKDLHRTAIVSFCLVCPRKLWCLTCNFVMHDAWYEKHGASTNLLLISTLLALDPLQAQHFVQRTRTNMWTVPAKSYSLKFFVVMYGVQNIKHTRKHLSNEYKLSFKVIPQK